MSRNLIIAACFLVLIWNNSTRGARILALEDRIRVHEVRLAGLKICLDIALKHDENEL